MLRSSGLLLQAAEWTSSCCSPHVCEQATLRGASAIVSWTKGLHLQGSYPGGWIRGSGSPVWLVLHTSVPFRNRAHRLLANNGTFARRRFACWWIWNSSVSCTTTHRV